MQIKRIIAYDAGKHGYLVPVSLPNMANKPGLGMWWNGIVHRWHRRAGK